MTAKAVTTFLGPISIKCELLSHTRNSLSRLYYIVNNKSLSFRVLRHQNVNVIRICIERLRNLSSSTPITDPMCEIGNPYLHIKRCYAIRQKNEKTIEGLLAERLVPLLYKRYNITIVAKIRIQTNRKPCIYVNINFFNQIAYVNGVTYDQQKKHIKLSIGKDSNQNFDVPHDTIHSASCKNEKTHIKSTIDIFSIADRKNVSNFLATRYFANFQKWTLRFWNEHTLPTETNRWIRMQIIYRIGSTAVRFATPL